MANYYQEGDYTATILSHTFTPGQYGVQLVIEIEPHVEGSAYPRTVYLPFLDESGNPSEKAEKTIEVLKALGYADDPSRLDKQSANPASLVGTETAAVCKYNRDGKERWYINTPREQKEREAVDRQVLRKLDALFGKQMKANKATTPPPAKPASQKKTPPPDPGVTACHDNFDAAMTEQGSGDDIPF